MNQLLLSAFHLRKLRQVSGRLDVHIVTDGTQSLTLVECQRLFSPWQGWMDVVSLSETPAKSADLAKVGIGPKSVVIAISADPHTRAQYLDATKALDAKCVVNEYPPVGTLENDLLREVSFFDFEFGGKNEWDGKPTVYAQNCLKQLSSTHCREYYPTFAFTSLRAPGSLAFGRPLKVMDIGCGPVSVLRWGAIHDEISITGLDPIIDLYAIVLARHGLDALPKIRCDHEVHGFAEEMEQLLPDNDFDVIYTQNALDHTQQPGLVVENISRKLAPHGLFAFQVATREGTRQKWDQLHKTDIYLSKGQLMYARQHSLEQPLLSPVSGLRLKRVEFDTPDWLACVVEKS